MTSLGLEISNESKWLISDILCRVRSISKTTILNSEVLRNFWLNSKYNRLTRLKILNIAFQMFNSRFWINLSAKEFLELNGWTDVWSQFSEEVKSDPEKMNPTVHISACTLQEKMNHIKSQFQNFDEIIPEKQARAVQYRQFALDQGKSGWNCKSRNDVYNKNNMNIEEEDEDEENEEENNENELTDTQNKSIQAEITKQNREFQQNKKFIYLNNIPKQNAIFGIKYRDKFGYGMEIKHINDVLWNKLIFFTEQKVYRCLKIQNVERLKELSFNILITENLTTEGKEILQNKLNQKGLITKVKNLFIFHQESLKADIIQKCFTEEHIMANCIYYQKGPNSEFFAKRIKTNVEPVNFQLILKKKINTRAWKQVILNSKSCSAWLQFKNS